MREMSAFTNFVDVEGRAEGFERLSDEPFYKFRMETGKGRLEVRGPENFVFQGKTISPAFTGIDVDWSKNPVARVYGRKESPALITAYIVNVKVGEDWKCWSYRQLIDNRALSLLSRYKKLSASEPSVKDFWFVGSLAGCDLLSVLRRSDGKPVEVPEEVVEKEALVRAVIRGQMGNLLGPKEIYVKEGGQYRRL